jgi:hypothetical protein
LRNSCGSWLREKARRSASFTCQVALAKARVSWRPVTNAWLTAFTGSSFWIFSNVTKYQAWSFTSGPPSDRNGR